MASTCARMSRPDPNSARLIATVTTTATVMVRFRRMPMPISLRTNCARTVVPYVPWP
jgi:hypothetical protein